MPLLAEPPERYFISVNTPWPSTQTALNTHGRFASAAFEAMQADPTLTEAYDAGTIEYLPFVENPAWIGRWSVPGRSVGLRYRLDHDGELVRRAYFPTLPSRFSAVFAFADEESCERVEKQLQWDPQNRREFRLLPDPRNRVTRLNFHTYTAARNMYMTERDFTPQEREELWKPYWEGDPPPLSPLPPELTPPLWEYLIDGVLELVR